MGNDSEAKQAIKAGENIQYPPPDPQPMDNFFEPHGLVFADMHCQL